MMTVLLNSQGYALVYGKALMVNTIAKTENLEVVVFKKTLIGKQFNERQRLRSCINSYMN